MANSSTSENSNSGGSLHAYSLITANYDEIVDYHSYIIPQ